MKLFLSILLSFYTVISFAEDIFPAHCSPFVSQGEAVKLSASKPSLVMMHNISQSDLWITHPVSNPGASAGWSSKLQPGNWSALALNSKEFEISCIESKPGHEQQVSCAEVLAICTILPEKMPENELTGPYWAGEDMNLSALNAYLASRGFKLPQNTN